MILDNFTKHYLIAAIWSSCDENDNPLDANYDIEDFSQESLAQAISVCAEFKDLAGGLLTQAYSLATGEYYLNHNKFSPEAMAAHDFWLTRNNHGAGFWDRRLGDIGDKLTSLCGHDGVFKPIYIYVGDNGQIYFS